MLDEPAPPALPAQRRVEIDALDLHVGRGQRHDGDGTGDAPVVLEDPEVATGVPILHLDAVEVGVVARWIERQPVFGEDRADEPEDRVDVARFERNDRHHGVSIQAGISSRCGSAR